MGYILTSIFLPLAVFLLYYLLKILLPLLLLSLPLVFLHLSIYHKFRTLPQASLWMYVDLVYGNLSFHFGPAVRQASSSLSNEQRFLRSHEWKESKASWMC